MHGGPTLPDATYSSSADRSAVLDECGIRIHELRIARAHECRCRQTAQLTLRPIRTTHGLSRSGAVAAAAADRGLRRGEDRRGCLRVLSSGRIAYY